MIWAAATVLTLIIALALFLFTRRRFAAGNVIASAVKFVGVLAPIALLAGALSFLPRASFGMYMLVIPVGIAYLFWLDLRFGVSARMGRIPTRRRLPDRGAAHAGPDPT